MKLAKASKKLEKFFNKNSLYFERYDDEDKISYSLVINLCFKENIEIDTNVFYTFYDSNSAMLSLNFKLKKDLDDRLKELINNFNIYAVGLTMALDNDPDNESVLIVFTFYENLYSEDNIVDLFSYFMTLNAVPGFVEGIEKIYNEGYI